MGVLHRKLRRDLWRLRGQVLAVALVVASGVALLVMSLSALSSLQGTASAYYQRHAFGDVFASLRRAPDRLAGVIADIPGVIAAQTRIRVVATADMPGEALPVMVEVLSLPDHGPPVLNRPALRSGRMPEPRRRDEALVLAPFAEAYGLAPGDHITVLMNGVRRDLAITGLALSPEHVYAISPGALMPDDRRFGVLWMGRAGLAGAYDLDGAFNSVSLALTREGDPRAVIDRLDQLLEPYGGSGAIGRADQISNWFLMNELAQLRSMARILPAIFLAAAAFLTNTVLGRLIEVERREISLMKAFGYRNAEVAVHYASLALAMAALGVLIGWGLGLALGRYNTALYADFFRFPFLQYRPGAASFAISAGVSLASALLGALWAVRRATALKPAEAMRPPLPARAGRPILPRGLTRRLDHLTRIVLRQIARAPLRAAVTVTGVALSVGVLVMAMQWQDAIDKLATSTFHDTQHQDISIGFVEPRALSARFDLARLPGVLAVEPVRIAPADFHAGPRRHRGAVTGYQAGAGLEVIHDARGWTWPVPAGGIVLSQMLAEKLAIGIGDPVTLKMLAGRRPEVTLRVAGIMQGYVGTPAFVDLAVLNRLLGDGPVLAYAALLVDPAAEAALLARLKDLPGLSFVARKADAIAQLERTMGETLLIFSSFFALFAATLAIGVIYNAARITLSERGRELATLRVLGFRRAEISYILLAEAAALTLVALPLGCLAGWGLVWLISESFRTELFRVPFAVGPAAYGKAVVVTLIAAAVSGLLVRRRLDRLDLIGVLKTRE